MRRGTQREKATITATTLAPVLAPASGYLPSIHQVIIYNQQGNIRTVTLYEDVEDMWTFAIGASGTIVHDFSVPEPLGIGSGLYAALDQPGSVEITVRYLKYDERTPVNLDPATFTNRVTRTPNIFGNQ